MIKAYKEWFDSLPAITKRGLTGIIIIVFSIWIAWIIQHMNFGYIFNIICIGVISYVLGYLLELYTKVKRL